MISLVEPGPMGRDLVEEVSEIFSPTGILSRSSNFEYRPQQQAMAVAAARALTEKTNLIVEAGTGVGKSLGYLIPSILFAKGHQKKAIISTHTINLQEQLVGKDLPMLRAALNIPFNYMLLKGRHNYLCTRRLQKAFLQADSLFMSSEIEELKRIVEWSKHTEDGSLSDFEIEPDAKVWQQVCSERGLCSPKLCGPGSEFAEQSGRPCFFQKARAQILQSDVLVLNHTLFFMHLGGLEDEPSGGILFKNDFVVFDEAHTVEQVASKHIGSGVSSAQVIYTLQRLWNSKSEKGLIGVLHDGAAMKLVAEAVHAANQFFREVEAVCDALFKDPEITPRFKRGGDTSGGGGHNAHRPREWSELRVRRPNLFEDSLSLPIQRVRERVSQLIKMCQDKDTAEELMQSNRRLAEIYEALIFFLKQTNEDYVYWVSRSGKGRTNIDLHAAPVDVAEFLRKRLFSSETSVVMTSATLSTGMARSTESEHGLDYFARRVGGEEAAKAQVGSPFDYERQMKMFVVSKMPDPRDATYQRELIRWIEHFIRQTHGKAFVLFTNFRLMLEVGERMAPFFDELGLECHIQGTGTPRTLMIEKFKADVDSVLFGTDSFWQGVDVPGEALSNVIITRLPFAVPDHPLIEARVERIEARGGDSFMEFSLPEAILKFRQGVGRLIRSKSDSGIVVTLDNRILTKRYGQAFINAIPKCPVETV
jgi:ATP-dependent DNA helicase DinG